MIHWKTINSTSNEVSDNRQSASDDPLTRRWNTFLFVEERILEISDSLVIMVDLAADTKRDDLSEFLK